MIKFHECDYDDEAHPCIRCARKKRLKHIQTTGECLPFYIVVYSVSRHYGGPEEGGWWYDNQIVETVRKVWSIPIALKLMRELMEEYPQPRWNRYSVLGFHDYVFDLIPNKDFIKEIVGKPRWE